MMVFVMVGIFGGTMYTVDMVIGLFSSIASHFRRKKHQSRKT